MAKKLKRKTTKNKNPWASIFKIERGPNDGGFKNLLRTPKKASKKIAIVKKAKTNAEGLKYSRTFKTVYSIKNLKPGKPVLSKKQFAKALAENIKGKINVGEFRAAKSMLPTLKLAKAGKLSQKKQLELERSGWVGTYTVDSGTSNKRAYTLHKVFTKKGLSKIFPDTQLEDSELKFIKRHLGYSSRTIKTLKNRMRYMQQSVITDPNDLNNQLKHIATTLGSWSGSRSFDIIIERMGGFIPAITKYYEEIASAGKRYGIEIDDIIRQYAPYFFGG